MLRLCALAVLTLAACLVLACKPTTPTDVASLKSDGGSPYAKYDLTPAEIQAIGVSCTGTNGGGLQCTCGGGSDAEKGQRCQALRRAWCNKIAALSKANDALPSNFGVSAPNASDLPLLFSAFTCKQDAWVSQCQNDRCSGIRGDCGTMGQSNPNELHSTVRPAKASGLYSGACCPGFEAKRFRLIKTSADGFSYEWGEEDPKDTTLACMRPDYHCARRIIGGRPDGYADCRPIDPNRREAPPPAKPEAPVETADDLRCAADLRTAISFTDDFYTAACDQIVGNGTMRKHISDIEVRIAGAKTTCAAGNAQLAAVIARFDPVKAHVDANGGRYDTLCETFRKPPQPQPNPDDF